MNLMMFLMRSSWQAIAIALTTGIVSGVCSAGLIALISYLMVQDVPPTGVIIGAFVGLGAVALTTAMVSRILLVRFSQEAVFELQLQLSRQILATELKPLETLGLPRLFAILTEDVQTVAAAAGVVPLLVINMASAAGCMVYISWLSWQVLILVLLITLVASLSCHWFLVRGRALLAVARDQQDRLFQHFRSLIDGIKELKLHSQGQQDFWTVDLQPTALSVKRNTSQGLSLFAVLDSWGKFIYFFAVGLVLFALPNWIGVSPETRFGYVLTFTYLLGPLDSVVSKLPILSRASIAYDKIQALNLSLTATHNLDVPLSSAEGLQQLELKGVTHTYRTDQGEHEFTLGPVDLTVYPGELTFIIGGNGSGKSTLAKVLTGLYTPQSGEIWLNGRLLSDENRGWYRQHFAAVFSDFYLFERLLGFDTSADYEKAKGYLHDLQLEHKVTIEDGQFSTIALSQGQRKRLTLLSAYLDNRPIYLFDEWAADQDPSFKHLFYTHFLLDLKAQGKAIFVISHDDHYFHLADHVLKLNYGQVEYDYRTSASRDISRVD